MQLIRRRRPPRPESLRSFPLGAVRVTEQFLPGDGPAKKKDLARAARPRRRHARPASTGSPPRASGWWGSAARCATSPPPPSGRRPARPRRPGLRDHARGAGRPRRELASLPVERARRRSRGSSPGAATSSSPRRVVIETVVELGGFDGIEVTEAGLRDGVFLARELLAASRPPLFEDVRAAAVRNLAIQYESDLAHVEHVAKLSLQMFDSLVGGRPVQAGRGERELLWAAAMLHDVGHDDLLRRPPQALALPDRERRAAGLRSARARPDRPDHPLPPQGHPQARRASRARRRRATRSCSTAAR